MKQLGIVDAAFTNLEHPNAPQQVGGLGIYDPSTAPGQFMRFKDVLESFEQRLNRIPLFPTRLVDVPMGLDRQKQHFPSRGCTNFFNYLNYYLYNNKL
ncbi:MAG: hypothetical protein OEQ90_06880 [Gammaproteobacteria bacterium]|nr:hypothetical protein [Gammaproteobacteria bacterium]